MRWRPRTVHKKCILYYSKPRTSLERQVRSSSKKKSTERIQRQRYFLCFNYDVPCFFIDIPIRILSWETFEDGFRIFINVTQRTLIVPVFLAECLLEEKEIPKTLVNAFQAINLVLAATNYFWDPFNSNTEYQFTKSFEKILSLTLKL